MRAVALGLALGLALDLGATPFDKGGLLGPGAREGGQAGAVVARPARAGAIWWNPAGLGLRQDFQLELGYGDILGGFRFDSSVSHRGWLDDAALGYGLGYRRQGFSVDVAEDEYAFGIAFPFTQDGRLQAGLALRALQARVLNLKVPGYGVDLGLHYDAPAPVDGLSFGVAARDIQAAVEWPAGPRSDPAQLFQVGVAWQFDPDSSVEFDSEFVSDPSYSGRGSQGFKLGAERWWGWPRLGLARLAALRLGYLQSNALLPAALGGQFSGGISLQYRGFSADYAFTQDSGGFGPSHRFSAEAVFGPVNSGARPTPRPTPRPTVSPTPGRPVELMLGLTAAPALFNPARGRLTLRVSAPEGAEADSSLIEIRPLTGPVVAQRRSEGLPLDFAWDGRRPGGGDALPGAYRASLAAFDAQGQTLGAAQASFTLEAGVGRLRLSPEADIFAPIAQSVRKEARLAVGSDALPATAWTLSIRRKGSRNPLRVIRGRSLPKTLAWNGRDRAGKRVPDGSYELTLQAGALSAKAEVAIDTRRPRLVLEAQPRVFKTEPNLAAVSFQTSLSGEAGIPSRWTLRIESLEGKALKSFSGVGSPPQSVAWNGVDDAGGPVPPGSLYYADFRVELESGAVATLPRLTLASRAEEPQLPFRVPLQTLRFLEGEEVIALEDFAGLKEAAAAVKKYSTDYLVQVEGHAAAGESGRGGLGELELSFLRAKAVRDFLIESEGLDPQRVRIAGYGAEGASSGDAGKARRAEVILYAR